MSAEYMNPNQLIERLIEFRDSGNFEEDFPVCYADSSGYDYYVKSVVLQDGSVILN